MENSPKTILVVEDEPPLLDLLKQILEGAGYKVVEAKDGAEARDMYRRREKEIDLVLCDVALPKFGGWTVYLMAKEINPEVKMILTSGYLDPKIKAELVKGGVKDFVPKPYVAETILRSVNEALANG
jgi:two-component system, cell cycle sensor histidine kinase and response regulator CckA